MEVSIPAGQREYLRGSTPRAFTLPDRPAAMLQRSPRRARLLVVPAVLLLALAACGDDDDSADDTDVTAAVTEPAGTEPVDTETTDTATTDTESSDTASDGTASGETYEADEYVDALVDEIGGDAESATCVGEAFVNAVGVERLEASGVTPEDFATSGSPAELGLEIDQANAASMQCDLEACPSLIDLFAEAADAPDDDVDCFRESITDSLVAELLVVQFVGGQPSQELLDAQTAMQACIAEGE